MVEPASAPAGSWDMIGGLGRQEEYAGTEAGATMRGGQGRIGIPEGLPKDSTVCILVSQRSLARRKAHPDDRNN